LRGWLAFIGATPTGKKCTIPRRPLERRRLPARFSHYPSECRNLRNKRSSSGFLRHVKRSTSFPSFDLKVSLCVITR
jgi:hypothetical protein